MTQAQISPSRRTTLAWIAAAAAFGPAAFGAGSGRALAAGWPAQGSPRIASKGYGTDPNLADKKVTWPLTLDPGQRALVSICADMMLPPQRGQKAPSALGIDAFLDEWLSAPYERQVQDRAAILPGLAWLDAESKNRFQSGFAVANAAQRSAIFDDIAFRSKVVPQHRQAGDFFDRLRGLVILGYYTTPEGESELGFVGNTPIEGVYPGPPREALDHLGRELANLKLTMPRPQRAA